MAHVEVYLKGSSQLLVKNKTRAWWFSLEEEQTLPLHEPGWNFDVSDGEELLIPHTLLIWT